MIWVSFYLEFEGERGQTWVMGHRPKPSQVFLDWQLVLAPMWPAWWTPAGFLKVLRHV